MLGFSSLLYTSYFAGNPLIGDYFSQNLLSTPKIDQEVANFFGCAGKKGLELEDQDNTLVSSHWEKHNVGNEFMVAISQKHAYMSRFTLALLDSTGWYYNVDYSYAEPSVWGRNKGCTFTDIDNCEFEEFCTGSDFDCDWDQTGMGKCATDTLTGTCRTVGYYSNTICIDENYELKNLNAYLYASERGGSYARCFNSNFRAQGLQPNNLNNRCYISVCSQDSKTVYVLIGEYIITCYQANQTITLPGLDGSFTCPDPI